jgi:hypothetical protein
MKILHQVLSPFATALFLAVVSFSAPAAGVRSDVDWSSFLARQDLVWDSLPKTWEGGAFIGNGLLGAMIYADSTNGLKWEVGRSDVTDRGDRIAIGQFVLKP